MRYYFKVLIVAVLSVLSSAPLFAQGIEPDVTVKYADRDTCVLYMDIYEPDASKVTCEDGKQRDMRYSDTAEINSIIEASADWEKSANSMRFGYCGKQRGFLRRRDL